MKAHLVAAGQDHHPPSEAQAFQVDLQAVLQADSPEAALRAAVMQEDLPAGQDVKQNSFLPSNRHPETG